MLQSFKLRNSFRRSLQERQSKGFGRPKRKGNYDAIQPRDLHYHRSRRENESKLNLPLKKGRIPGYLRVIHEIQIQRQLPNHKSTNDKSQIQKNQGKVSGSLPDSIALQFNWALGRNAKQLLSHENFGRNNKTRPGTQIEIVAKLD